MEAKIPIDHPTLSQHFGQQEFQAGDMIIHVGDVLSDLIIIDSGEVDLIDLLISDSTTYRTLNQPGCCVGGASFLSQTPSMYGVRATKKTTVYTLSHRLLSGLVLIYPELALKVLEPMANNICMAVRHYINEIVHDELPFPSINHHDRGDLALELPREQIPFPDISFDNFLFNDFLSDQSILSEIRENIKTFRYKKNQRVFSANQSEKVVYVILSGTLQTYIPMADRNIKLTTSPPGGEVGIIGFLDGLPYPTSCFARETSIVIELTEGYLTELRLKNKAWYQKMLAHMMISSAYTLNRFSMHYKSMKILQSLPPLRKGHV